LHSRSEKRASYLGELASQAAGIVIGDLASAEETRSVAEQVNRLGRMNAVIHNAGIYSQKDRGTTAEGHASVLAVNTLAPYILTALIQRPDRLIYLSSGLHRGGEGSLPDLDWKSRRWDTARAYSESKLHDVAIAFYVARQWPHVVSSAVDPGWVRTRMGGPNAPLDLDTGQRTQSWLATSSDPTALVSGQYWHNLKTEKPAAQAADAQFQDQLINKLREITGLSLH
jgi:NAD(P)-dependent dehydrogenase (short-subunit alcohol dehydrogenase family)